MAASEGATSVDMLKDDFLCQEQYIIELPDPVAEVARRNQNFAFELVFDITGQSGEMHIAHAYEGLLRIYPFRVFKTPLTTESYVSADGDYYYKSADISDIIVVYEPDKIPKLFVDYEISQKIKLIASTAGNPVFDPSVNMSPHGLTPPTAWAPFHLWPNIPTRPAYFPPASDEMVAAFDEIHSEKKNQSSARSD